MTDKALADILARTYAHRVTAFRPLAEGGRNGSARPPLRPEPLGAHQRPHAAVPFRRLAGGGAVPAGPVHRPELAFRLGDRVEVTDEGGSV